MADNQGVNHKGKPNSPYVENSSLKADEHNTINESPEQIQSLPDVEVTLEAEDMQVASTGFKFADNKQVAGTIYPARFNKVIPSIAQCTEAGYVCFLNPESLELEQVSGKMLDNPEAFYASSGSSSGQDPFQHLLWNNYLMFEPIPEEELYLLMEDFLQYLAGQPVYDKLNRLMMKRKPFNKLNTLLVKSDHSDFWVRYKEQYIEKRTKDKLTLLLIGMW